MDKQKIKYTLYLLLIVFLIYFSSNYIFQEEEFTSLNVEDICGVYPQGFIKEDISSNPNYVFENDINFDSRKLWDEFENTVFVNSFIECDHYVSGGWNYVPNENYIPEDNDPCQIKQDLNKTLGDGDKVYLKDIDLKIFFSQKKYLCMGKIYNLTIKDNITYFEVLYSRVAYLISSQLLPILFLLLFRKINWKFFVSVLIFYQLLVQMVFNYKFGLNLINSVSVFTSLMIAAYLYEVNNENDI